MDTGATASLMSISLFQTLGLPLKSTTLPVVTADNKPMVIHGTTVCNVTVGKQSTNHTFYIADVDVGVLLGLDFLDTNQCSLDLEKQQLKWGGTCVPILNTRTVESCRRVAVATTVTIPPGEEMMVPGKVAKDPVGLGLIEPTAKFHDRFPLMMATTLLCDAQSPLYMSIWNPGDEPVIIYGGTHIGLWTPVTEVISRLDQTDDPIPVVRMVGSTDLCAEPEDDWEIPEYLESMWGNSSDGLDDDQQRTLKAFIRDHEDLFMKPGDTLPGTDLVMHEIDTGNHAPIRQAPRRVPIHQRAELEAELHKMVDEGILEPGAGAWSSPLVLVLKKDGSLRVCVCYKRLNDVTRKDAYPIPRIDATLDALTGSMYFSTLDLASGYYQVKMHPRDKDKTAISTHIGLFTFLRLPFGLCNAPSTFERLMERVLQGLQWHQCLLYLDDVIVFAPTFELQMERLKNVFARLRAANLRMKAKKCFLCRDKVEYLGHIVSREGISTSDDKIAKVRDWPVPTSPTEVRQFLGLTSYYRRFVRAYAEKARPLHKLTEKDREFVWSEACQEAFESLKLGLISAPILAFPDPELAFVLDTDCSHLAMGGVLSQVCDGVERPVAYASFCLSKSERNYCVTRQELLAAVRMIKHFRPYLYAKHFTLRTDHGSLRWLFNFKEPQGQLARWLEVLSSYDFTIVHRAGRSHQNADSLSRYPCSQCKRESHEEVGEVIRANRVLAVPDPGELDSLTAHQLREWQEKDAHVKQLIDWMGAGDKPPITEVRDRSPEVKALWGKWDLLLLKESVLYVQWESDYGDEVFYRLVVPRGLQQLVMTWVHDVPTSGHLGFIKTWDRAVTRFYWFKMADALRQWVAGCLVCAKAKGRKGRAPLCPYAAGHTLQIVVIDLVVSLPLTARANRHILVVTCKFTKFTEAFPLPDMEAETVARTLVDGFITRYGVPDQVHSDQGRQFSSAVFREAMKLLGVRLSRSSPYHPQGAGQVERCNRTLRAMLAAYAEGHPNQWDETLQLVMMAYRSAVHESTGETPNRLMFGREVRLPLDMAFGIPVSDSPVETTYAAQVACVLTESHDKVRAKMGVTMRRQKEYYDRSSREATYEVGDVVMLSVEARGRGACAKLQPRWEGPLIVTHKLGTVNVRIQASATSRPQVVHVDRVKPYRGAYDKSWWVAQEQVPQRRSQRQHVSPQRYGDWVLK